MLRAERSPSAIGGLRICKNLERTVETNEDQPHPAIGEEYRGGETSRPKACGTDFL